MKSTIEIRHSDVDLFPDHTPFLKLGMPPKIITGAVTKMKSYHDQPARYRSTAAKINTPTFLKLKLSLDDFFPT